MNETPENPGQVLESNRGSNGRFLPGRSGNPRGKPKGRTAAGLLRDKLGKRNVDALIEKARAMAMSGNASCVIGLLRLLVPAPKEQAMNASVELPPLVDADSALAAIRTVADATAAGLIDHDQSRALMGVINGYLEGLRVTEVADIDARLRAIEERTTRP